MCRCAHYLPCISSYAFVCVCVCTSDIKPYSTLFTQHTIVQRILLTKLSGAKSWQTCAHSNANKTYVGTHKTHCTLYARGRCEKSAAAVGWDSLMRWKGGGRSAQEKRLVGSAFQLAFHIWIYGPNASFRAMATTVEAAAAAKPSDLL